MFAAASVMARLDCVVALRQQDVLAVERLLSVDLRDSIFLMDAGVRPHHL
jgi:hypothetical protein